MAFTMLVFGTLGPFINNMNFPSSFISFARAIIGSLFIGIFMAVSGHGFDGKAILKNLKLLIPSGIAMAFNWICLFEAYRFTGVTVATLCYYMAPVIVVAASPFILKERLTAVKGDKLSLLQLSERCSYRELLRAQQKASREFFSGLPPLLYTARLLL